MDALAALRLLIDWGADEALDDAPVDRRGDPAVRTLAPARPPVPQRPAPLHPTEGRALEARPATPARPTTPARPAAPAVPATPAPLAAPLAASVAELRAALAAFDGCGLRTTAKSLAFADGNPAASLVLIGEAPSDDDDREGRPFAGPGGAQLDRVFASIGLDRTRMMLTLVVPWRPPGGKRAPTASEVASCLPFLHRHLALVRPRRLVLFGGGVTRAMGLGADPIGRLRGTWRDVAVPGFGSIPALPMRAVDSALKTAALKRELWNDLMKLRTALSEDNQG